MTTESSAYTQAAAQMRSVSAMVAALECDYDRLAELRDTPADELPDDEKTELAELIEAAGDCESEDEARDRITEDALSVEVRSGWNSIGETPELEEFRIVLCTGGPHVEIRGRLNQANEPERCGLHYANWGDSGQYFGDALDTDALETYARQFYFGA